MIPFSKILLIKTLNVIPYFPVYDFDIFVESKKIISYLGSRVLFYAAEAAAWNGDREEAKAELRMPPLGRGNQERDFRILSLVRCRIDDVVIQGTLTDE